MSLTMSQEDQQSAFTEKLEVSGETFTFRSLPIVAIVALFQASPLDASVPQLVGRSLGGHLAADIRPKSTLEFLKDAVASAPRAGEDLIESDGRTHRIKEMFTNELTYLCRCHISPGP